MNLPKQVREAGERADQALEQHRTAAAATTDTPDPGTETPQPGSDQPPSAQPPSNEPERQPTRDDGTDYRAKYFTLQGMYNAEVPRLRAELKAANDRIGVLSGEIAEHKAKQTSAPAAPALTSEPKPIAAPAALVAALGQEAADAMMAALAAEAKGIRADVGKDLAPVREQAESATKTAEQMAVEHAAAQREAFMRALSVRVPRWQTIDSDERWLAYLAEKSREARRPRQELLAEAYQEGDLDAVAWFFEDFMSRNGITPAGAPAAPANPTNANDALARQEVPAASGRASAGMPEAKKIWTQKQVRQFYADVTKGGVYTRERAMEIEREIDAAAKEGRVH